MERLKDLVATCTHITRRGKASSTPLSGPHPRCRGAGNPQPRGGHASSTPSPRPHRGEKCARSKPKGAKRRVYNRLSRGWCASMDSVRAYGSSSFCGRPNVGGDACERLDPCKSQGDLPYQKQWPNQIAKLFLRWLYGNGVRRHTREDAGEDEGCL